MTKKNSIRQIAGFLFVLTNFSCGLLAASVEMPVSESRETIVEAPSSSRKHVVGFEGLGRAFLYSGFYEYTLAQNKLGLGGSISFLGSSSPFASVYLNSYTSPERSRGYLTLGFLGTNQNSVFSAKDSDRGFYRYGIPNAGIGWEYRSKESLVLRATGYAFLFAGSRLAFVLPWVGASIGTTF